MPVVTCLSRPGSMLDVGCGNGLLLASVRAKAEVEIEPFGIDRDPRAIVRVRRLLPEFAGNFAHLDAWETGRLPDAGLPERYDYVHLLLWDDWDLRSGRQVEFLEGLRDLVNDGGALVISTLERAEPISEIGRRLRAFPWRASKVIASASGRSGCITLQPSAITEAPAFDVAAQASIPPALHTFVGPPELVVVAQRMSHFVPFLSMDVVERLCRLALGKRRAGTFLIERRERAVALIAACVELGLSFGVRKKSGFFKVVVAHRTSDVDEIWAMEDKVFFPGRPTAIDVERYGASLGYPNCCAKAFARGLGVERWANPLGRHFASASLWPAELNVFIHLIEHVPCHPRCRDSAKLGACAIDIRNALGAWGEEDDEGCTVLHFGENLWVAFRPSEPPGGSSRSHVASIASRHLRPHLEGGDRHRELTSQLEVCRAVEAGAVLRVDEQLVELTRPEGRTMRHRKRDSSDGCLIRFSPAQPRRSTLATRAERPDSTNALSNL